MRSKTFSRRRAREFSPTAKFPCFLCCCPIRGTSPGESSRRLASLGSHSPLADRRATRAARHSPGEERANSRQRRDSRTGHCRHKVTSHRRGQLRTPVPTDGYFTCADRLLCFAKPNGRCHSYRPCPPEMSCLALDSAVRSCYNIIKGS